jgi:hypothetical protein
MRLSPTDLLDSSRYQMVGELEMNNPGPFFNEQAKDSQLTKVFFLLVLISLGILTGVSVAKAFQDPRILWQIVVALVSVFIALLPLHEAIHALAYKTIGAADIRFSYAWRKLAVFTCAHRFVIGIREVIPLAIAPLLLISLLLLALLYALPDYRFLVLWILVIHTSLCGGDLILLGYALRHYDQEIYNYDDVEMGKSYFYRRVYP